MAVMASIFSAYFGVLVNLGDGGNNLFALGALRRRSNRLSAA